MIILRKFLILFLCVCLQVQWSPLAAQDAAYSNPREIESLATNVDKAIQACGLHVSHSSKQPNEYLIEKGISLSDEAPDVIKALASPSSFGASRYHRWLDPHAEIWLIASKEKPSCRIAISGSQWVTDIGERLDKLIQVGKFWRPAKEGESPIAQKTTGPRLTSYIMDTPEAVSVRPLLIITAAPQNIRLAGGQQMIITIFALTKSEPPK